MTISQEAREAAADALDAMGVDWGACGDVREGRVHHPLAAAFARFEAETLERALGVCQCDNCFDAIRSLQERRG